MVKELSDSDCFNSDMESDCLPDHHDSGKYLVWTPKYLATDQYLAISLNV